MKAVSQNFCQKVAAAATARPDNVAMTILGTVGSEEITFGSMLQQVYSIAARLQKEEILAGDRVALIADNHPNWAIAYLGILFNRSVVTPLDPAATPNTIANFLAHAETKLIFADLASVDKVTQTCAQLGWRIPIVLLDEGKVDSSIHGLARFCEWAGQRSELPNTPPSTSPEDLALLMYTSGTTGRPKAVPLTHGNIQAQINAVQEVMKITDAEVVLSILPLFHAYSQIVNLWLAATIGARVVYLNQFGSSEIEQGLKRSGATALTGVPRLWYLFHKKIFDALNTRPAPFRYALKIALCINGALRDYCELNLGRILFRKVHKAFGGKLRLAVSGGAIFDRDVAKDFHRLGFTILQGYGLTETSGAVTVTRFEDNTIGSVGTSLKGVEVRISEPDGDGVGEVLIRGPIVTSGYYLNPTADQEAFTSDRWFRSGDLGRFDRGGHLYIVGRKKDVIILPSGKNVFPEDVEAHYGRSPLINEICVLGKRDGNSFNGGESLFAIVVPDFEYLKAQRISNPGEWIPWELEDLGRDLPEYQRVHDFAVRTEPLPRTTTRKIRRNELQQQIKTVDGARRARSNGHNNILTVEEANLLDSAAGRAVTAIIREFASDATVHPLANLEIDLRLDSLARIECFTRVEQALGVQFRAEETVSVLTVGDLVRVGQQSSKQKTDFFVAQSQIETSVTHLASNENKRYWRGVLSDDSTVIPELKPFLNRSKLTILLADLLMPLVRSGARLFFRMQVEGREILNTIDPPYLICPNHQSYIDPFLVCSVLPREVLANILHLGASRYFTGLITSQLAKLIGVVPIDPDVHLLRAMRAGAVALRNKKIVNIYPEGRRSFDGQLSVFKKGAAVLATELNVPIIPVSIDGTYQIWPRRSARIRLGKVRISFGEPVLPDMNIPPDSKREERYERLTELIKARVQQMLNEIRHV